MPWKDSSVMNERMRFIVRLEQGERMSDVCRAFGISRKTGYKFWNRYKEFGPNGLFDESRRPIVLARRTTEEIKKLIVDLKGEYPTWGARKLKVKLRERHPCLSFPVHSTIHKILYNSGLVKHRRSRYKSVPTFNGKLTVGKAPNDVWSADFKGQFQLGNRSYCYPLTISDYFSRYLISCEALDKAGGCGVRYVFEAAFRKYGLPEVIRTDNGTPFAARSLGGLTNLSVWWLRLGIKVERIEPGHPEQNGRHERMHLTLKHETTRPPGHDLLQQQERFDNFIEQYNTARPHEALGMKSPAHFYVPSTRLYRDVLPDLEYSLYDFTRKVSPSGKVHLYGKTKDFFLSKSLAGEKIGIREVEVGIWLISFMNINLGYVDEKTGIFESTL